MACVIFKCCMCDVFVWYKYGMCDVNGVLVSHVHGMWYVFVPYVFCVLYVCVLSALVCSVCSCLL